MELKGFQKEVIGDLGRFLSLLTECENIRKAYNTLWEEKGVPIGPNGMQPYHMSIKGVPQVCLKVPTGGGKTFLAANSIRPIFDAMPHIHPKAVAWLVPSDAILRQTVRTLSDHEHPYRQKIDADFAGKVEIYTKEQLLTGQNFNPASVDENLSVFVLTYDSFRTSKKDGRKAYQQNGNLTLFPQYFDDRQALLPDTDETALIQVIRSLNPVVVVDESHHAVSKLSVEMLTNFNPCFVLELTATPKKDSNIISVVDARKLKKEEMVKLPVIVYNQKNQEDVFLSAIALRRRLEEEAMKAEQDGGRYVRPIVLFQAQPRTGSEATTFDRIKQSLLEMGIPAEHIAIKTGEKDEIKDTDLLSRDCPIRYIITVNALKEGWDCPFAYILATVANRSSVVDVEQILGRILRMPYAKAGKRSHLNISYAITSSADFYRTLDKVVDGLVNSGFSKRDHRVGGFIEIEGIQPAGPNEQMTLDTKKEPEKGEDLPEIHTEDIKSRLDAMNRGAHLFDERSGETGTQTGADNLQDTSGQSSTAYGDRVAETTGSYSTGADSVLSKIDQMLQTAEQENRMYWESMNTSSTDDINVPREVAEKLSTFYIRPEFKEEVKGMVLPQFLADDGITYFNETGHVLLERDELRAGFSLRDKDTMIDFGSIRAELAKVDLDEGQEAVPRAFRLHGFENESMKKWFDAKPSDAKRKICKEIIVKRISKINAISDAEIEEYVERVMANMSEAVLSDLEQAPELYANRIREKVEKLLAEHESKVFHLWMEQDKIVCEPNYHFKEKITPAKSISSIPKSLYEEEDGDLNDYERQVIWEISALDNVKWWHRNIARRGFAINGAVTAYPDLIIHTESGKTLMVETKGDHLDNAESKAKAQAGAEWASMAGRLYKYYMVFQTKTPGYAGAYSYDDFMRIVRDL